MRIVHFIYFGFFLLIDFFERCKGFSASRAVNGMTFTFALVLASIFELVFSYVFCYRIGALTLIIVTFSLSFITNEYYFTHKGKGDQIVEQAPRIVNNLITIILAVAAAFFCILIFVYSIDLSKVIISYCE